jgi:hypothetical protein
MRLPVRIPTKNVKKEVWGFPPYNTYIDFRVFSRDRCCDIKNIFAENFCKKLAFLTKLNFKKVDHNIGI